MERSDDIVVDYDIMYKQKQKKKNKHKSLYRTQMKVYVFCHTLTYTDILSALNIEM